jgi:hypothetical protein
MDNGLRIVSQEKELMEVDPLVDARLSTTLWKEKSSGDEFAATLRETGGDVSPAYHMENECVSVVPSAKFTVLHIAKQNGRYVPFVNGAIPHTMEYGADPSAGIPGREIHLIHSHTGLHVDREGLENESEERQERGVGTVFSPCAAMVTVEDGESRPTQCTVRIWNQLKGYGDGSSIGNRILSGDRRLRAGFMDEPTVDVVCTPFPVARSRKQRVVIYDQRKVFQADLQRVQTEMRKILSKNFGSTDQDALVKGMYGQTAVSKALFNIIDANVSWFFQGKKPEEVVTMTWTEWGASKLGWGDWAKENLEQRQQEQQDQATAGLSTDVEVLQYKAVYFAGPILTLFFPIMLSQLSGSLLVSALGSGSISALLTWFKATQFTTYMDYIIAFSTGMIHGIFNYFTRPPTKQADKLYFTLDELASALEVLGRVAKLSKQDLTAATADRKFRRETALWAWLMQSSEKSQASNWIFGRKDNTGYFSQATIDTSELYDASTDSVPHRLTQVETMISIVIEDPAICKGKPVEFDFMCLNDTRHLLSLAGQGVSSSIDRLVTAIQNFEHRLEESLRRRFVPTQLSELYTESMYFWDSMTYSPFYAVLMSSMPVKFKADGDKTLEQLGIHRAGVIKMVKKNLRSKLSETFVHADSPGQKLKAAVDAAVETRIPQSLTEKKPQWIRTLPHVPRSMDLLFPAPDVLALDISELETPDVFVREQSGFKDAVEDMKRVFGQEQRALRHLRVYWCRIGERMRLVCGYNASQGFRLRDTLRVSPPLEFYSLVVSLPTDVRRLSVSLDETTRHRMRFIADRNATSAIRRVSTRLNDDETSLFALALFAELWTDELVALAQVRDTVASRVRRTLETALARAKGRAQRCADVMAAITNGQAPEFLAANDEFFRATQPGRDLARLARRLRLSSGSPYVAIQEAQRVARVLQGLASEKGPNTTMPSEPLQSLFMDVAHGHRAYQRAVAMTSTSSDATKIRVQRAFASAYPSLLFDRGGVAAVTAQIPDRPPQAHSVEDVVLSLRIRMAKLQLDFPTLDVLDTAITTQPASGDTLVTRLAEELAVFSIERANSTPSRDKFGVEKSMRFAVPFGYGDAPPPLVPMPVSALGFGSVPVWVDDVRTVLAQALTALDPASLPALSPVVHVTSRGPCAPTDGRGVEHPTIIKVVDRATLTFEFAHSEVGPSGIRTTTDAVPVSALDAVQQHVQSPETLALSDAVCGLAWNSERVLQCVLAGVSQLGSPTCEIVSQLPDTLRSEETGRVMEQSIDVRIRRIEDVLETTANNAIGLMQKIIVDVIGVEGRGSLQPAPGDQADEDDPITAASIDDVHIDLSSRPSTSTGAVLAEMPPKAQLLLIQIKELNPKSNWFNRQELLEFARTLREYEKGLYDSLLRDENWRTTFTANLKQGLKTNAKDKMEARLRKYRNESEDANDLYSMVDDTEVNVQEIDRLKDLEAQRREAELGSASRWSKERHLQRIHLAVAHVVGVAMSRSLVEPVKPVLTKIRWQLLVRQKLTDDQVIQERDRLNKLFQRFDIVLKEMAGKALRLSELCTALFLEI